MSAKISWLGRTVCAAVACLSLGSAASGDNIVNYVTNDADVFGLRTFTWVHGNSGSFTTQITGTQTVTFGNGQSFLGVWQSNGEHDGESDLLLYVDANGVQNLAFGGHFLADDAAMYAPSSRFSFGEFSVGVPTQVPDFYYEIPMGGGPVIHNENAPDYYLFVIQDATVPYASYANCLILWELDSDYGYTTLNLDGLDADLGIALPTSTDTGGRAVTGLTILAPGFSDIAYGDVDAATGMLGEMHVLTDWQPVPEPASLGLLALGGLAMIRRRRKA